MFGKEMTCSCMARLAGADGLWTNFPTTDLSRAQNRKCKWFYGQSFSSCRVIRRLWKHFIQLGTQKGLKWGHLHGWGVTGAARVSTNPAHGLCLGMKGGRVVRNADSLRKRDSAASTERAKRGQRCSCWRPSIKASPLKGENFLPCFCSSFPVSPANSTHLHLSKESPHIATNRERFWVGPHSLLKHETWENNRK